MTENILFPHGLDVIVDLWKAFSAMKVDANDCILSKFMDFPVGTKRQEVYEWFDRRFPDGCMGLDAIVEGK